VLLNQVPSGANRRMVELLKRLPERLPDWEIYAGIQRRLTGAFEFPGVTIVPVHATGSYSAWGTLARAMFLKNEIGRLCRERDIDLCHLFSRPPFRASGALTLLTIHDNRYLRFPGQYGWLRHIGARLARGKVRRLDGIITVSRAMRDEIERLYGTRRVFVVPNGVSPPDRSWEPQTADPYVVSVLRREPRKGLETLLAAVEGLSGVRTFIIGCDGTDRPGVRFLGQVEDAERERLLAGALAFVFPSWYEGFGLPPLEAQAMGVPVVAARIPAVEEVLGDAALYCPPRDAGALRENIRRIVTDGELRQRLSAEGHRNAARYTWDGAADALARVYSELLKHR
jgi:glycosyltransferase involved in cell wall biosynthesis